MDSINAHYFCVKIFMKFSMFSFGFISVVEYGKQYNVEVFFPKLEVDGMYDVSGQILLLPIKGHGPFHGTFSEIIFLGKWIFSLQSTNFSNISVNFYLQIGDCTGSVRLQFGRKEGTDLVMIKKFNIKIKVGKGALKLSNLFNGDKVLGKCEHQSIEAALGSWFNLFWLFFKFQAML